MDSPREPKKEEEGAAASPYCRKVDTERTYNRLCAKKRIMYAKEVLAEKKAVELTAKFEADKEAYFAKKASQAQARAKTLYEKQVQARITADQEARINARMRAEERHQVMQMISDSRSRKMGTAAATDEEALARDYMRAARMAHDEDKRAKRLEAEEQRREQLLEKRAAAELRMIELRNERIQEQGDKQVEGRRKRAAQYAKIEERRKVLAAKEEEERAARQEKFDQALRAAEERREYTQMAKVSSLSQRSTSCHERAEANLRELDLQLSARAHAPPDREQELERRKAEERLAKRQEEEQKELKRHQLRLAAFERQEQQQREKELKILEKHAKVRQPGIVLVQESQDPQLAYLRVKRDLEGRRDHAKITKQYDSVFPDAEELLTERGQADVRLARLQALEQDVMKGQLAGGSTNYNDLSSDQQKKVFGQRTLRCGLCEQDYAADLLKGKTTVSRIEKLRRGWRGDAGQAEKHHHAGSYDQVRLCTMCLQFVRQHAKETK